MYSYIIIRLAVNSSSKNDERRTSLTCVKGKLTFVFYGGQGCHHKPPTPELWAHCGPAWVLDWDFVSQKSPLSEYRKLTFNPEK
jgi:hypothetical protein